MQNPSLPENLVSRAKRIYVASRTFKNDSGENVNYERLVLEFAIKGEPYEIEAKIDRKDKVLLALTDAEEGSL